MPEVQRGTRGFPIRASEYIILGLFFDDMMHIYSRDAIKDEFMQLYSKTLKSLEPAR